MSHTGAPQHKDGQKAKPPHTHTSKNRKENIKDSFLISLSSGKRDFAFRESDMRRGVIFCLAPGGSQTSRPLAAIPSILNQTGRGRERGGAYVKPSNVYNKRVNVKLEGRR